MTAEQIFSVCNLAATCGWIVLIFAPRWSRSAAIAGRAIPVTLAAVYTVFLLTHWRGSTGGFSSLAAVSALFANPWLLLAGWVHYLAFDLFVGSWISEDAKTRGVPHLLVIPCLILTFLVGPVGLLLYLGLRTVRRPAAA